MKKIFYILFAMLSSVYAVSLVNSFTFDDSLMYEGIGSNSVTDMVQLSDSLFFFATENGLSFTQDRGGHFSTYYSAGKTVRYGAVTGMTALDDHIWIATAYDSSVYDGLSYSKYPAGNGISYSPDGGETWQRFAQSVDTDRDTMEIVFGDTIPALPITSRINNITYDLAVQVTDDDTLLWSVNFAGGTRVSRDNGETWTRVVLPPDYYDEFTAGSAHDFDLSPTSGALGYESNLNHRAFSVDVCGDTIAVGTANGINVSTDGGSSWLKYTAQNSGICGNFIVDLNIDGSGNIYGAALSTSDSENRGLVRSYTNINGLRYWQTDLDGKRLYSVTTGAEDRIYASTENGLWYSPDGWNWVQIDEISDAAGQIVLDENVYCAYEDDKERLWVGTGDGLAVSDDFGQTWELTRRVRKNDDGDLHVSAYPNPFSPSRMNVRGDDGHVRIHCDCPEAGNISIEVYDFSMTRVKKVADHVYVDSQNLDFVWNGRNGLNNIVANGVYFVKLIFSGTNETLVAWDKLIILN